MLPVTLILCRILEFEYSAPYTPECPPIDELDIGELGDSSINVVVKKHPDNKFMDSNEENGPIGVSHPLYSCI